MWGFSSAGRALRWQRRGHGFESRMLHQNIRYDRDCPIQRLYLGFYFWKTAKNVPVCQKNVPTGVPKII